MLKLYTVQKKVVISLQLFGILFEHTPWKQIEHGCKIIDLPFYLHPTMLFCCFSHEIIWFYFYMLTYRQIATEIGKSFDTSPCLLTFGYFSSVFGSGEGTPVLETEYQG